MRASENEQQTYDEISHEKWRFGETPDFSHHLEGRFEAPAPWGTIDVHIDSRKGEIVQAKVAATTPPSSAPSSASNAAHKIGVVLHAGSSSWAGSKGGRQASSEQCLPQGAGREEEAWREVTCQALARCICMAAGADGRVLGVQVFSDSLYPDLMDALALALQGMCPCPSLAVPCANFGGALALSCC